VWEKRREIMRRRRVNDEYMASWFRYLPVSRPAPRIPARSQQQRSSRAVQG
jgi:hypothetical protein